MTVLKGSDLAHESCGACETSLCLPGYLEPFSGGEREARLRLACLKPPFYWPSPCPALGTAPPLAELCATPSRSAPICPVDETSFGARS